jgi:hypothetical protein
MISPGAQGLETGIKGELTERRRQKAFQPLDHAFQFLLLRTNTVSNKESLTFRVYIELTEKPK